MNGMKIIVKYSSFFHFRLLFLRFLLILGGSQELRRKSQEVPGSPKPSQIKLKSSQIQPKSNRNQAEIESNQMEIKSNGNPAEIKSNRILGNPHTVLIQSQGILGNPKKQNKPRTSFVARTSFVGPQDTWCRSLQDTSSARSAWSRAPPPKGPQELRKSIGTSRSYQESLRIIRTNRILPGFYEDLTRLLLFTIILLRSGLPMNGVKIIVKYSNCFLLSLAFPRISAFSRRVPRNYGSPRNYQELPRIIKNYLELLGFYQDFTRILAFGIIYDNFTQKRTSYEWG